MKPIFQTPSGSLSDIEDRMDGLGDTDAEVRDLLVKYFCCRICGGSRSIGSIACTCVDPVTEMPKNKPWTTPTAAAGVAQPKAWAKGSPVIIRLTPDGWTIETAGATSDPVATLAGALKGAALVRPKRIKLGIRKDRRAWALAVINKVKEGTSIPFVTLIDESTSPKPQDPASELAVA